MREWSVRLIRILLILSLGLLLGSAKPPQMVISGVKGKPLKNIQTRLAELYEDNTAISLENIQEEVANALKPFGYFSPVITVTQEGQRKFNITVLKGLPVSIKTLSIHVIGSGALNPEILSAKQNLPLKLGEPFNSQLYEEAKQILLNAAEHEGYLRASFALSEALVNPENRTVDIHLMLDTGPQYYFGQVRFNRTYLHPDFLARYIPFKDGETYSTEQILALNSHLSASGYFKDVTIKPQIGDAREVPIDVLLKPAPNLHYSLGLGYGTDTGPRGRAGLHVIPVNQYGHKFNAILQGSFKENALLTQYVIPGKNPVTDQYNFNASLSNLDYAAGYSNSLLLSAATRHIVSTYQQTLSLNALYERFDYSQEPKQEETTLFPKGTLTFRHVDDTLFSKSGYNVTTSALGGSKIALSGINFAQGSVDARAALTIDAIRTRFYAHAIQGYTAIQNIDTLPLSLALLLGGSEDMRAYSFNSIGPGQVISYGGIEVQKETFKKWYVLGFFDAGDVYQPTPADFKYDVGAGLMWVSPVGPIKVSVAQAVSRGLSPIEGRNPRLVIAMGPEL